MSLHEITDKKAILDAIKEYDSLGQQAFLRKYGFMTARKYFLSYNGKLYPSKAIIGVAHGFQHPKKGILKTKDFSGGHSTVEKKLNDLGFKVINDSKTVATPLEFPPLEPKSRSREYESYSQIRRSEVVKAFLFKGLSHRDLDRDILGVDPEYSRGWQSKGILTYLGLVNDHKGIFKGLTTKSAIAFLQTVSNPNLSGVLRHMEEKDPNPNGVNHPSTNLKVLQQQFEKDIKTSQKDTKANRQVRLKNAMKKPTQIQATTTVYKRNADVVAEVLEQANGICQKCKSPAPFNRSKDGTPFLEVHHWKPLANGGEDIVKNAIALCPNCHREEHYG